MKFVNLTPHQICVEDVDGKRLNFPSDGVARVSSKSGKAVTVVDGVLLCEAPTYGEVEGLPAPQEGVIYIVSALVAARCVGRPDVFSPGTGPSDGAIREGGQIVAVTRLIRAPQF